MAVFVGMGSSCWKDLRQAGHRHLRQFLQRSSIPTSVRDAVSIRDGATPRPQRGRGGDSYLGRADGCATVTFACSFLARIGARVQTDILDWVPTRANRTIGIPSPPNTRPSLTLGPWLAGLILLLEGVLLGALWGVSPAAPFIRCRRFYAPMATGVAYSTVTEQPYPAAPCWLSVDRLRGSPLGEDRATPAQSTTWHPVALMSSRPSALGTCISLSGPGGGPRAAGMRGWRGRRGARAVEAQHHPEGRPRTVRRSYRGMLVAMKRRGRRRALSLRPPDFSMGR